MSIQTSTDRADTSTRPRPHLVVGVDSTDPSPGAVAWARDEAARAHLSVRLVSACHVYVGPVPPRPQAYLAPDVEDATRSSLTSLGARLDDVDVLPSCIGIGSPARVVLAALDGDTDLVVVGRRPLAAAGRLVVGSTSLALAGRSPVPVVVVPDSWSTTERRSAPVVVGTALGADDLSPSTTDIEVLRFAFDRARRLRVPLVVVHAWEIPTAYAWSPADIAHVRDRVTERLVDALEPWRAEYPDVELVPRAVAEPPVDATLDASRVGQLVVVGRHTGHAAHHGLRLGSTARGVLHGARTPVAVVPLDASGPDDGTGSDVWAPTY